MESDEVFTKLIDGIVRDFHESRLAQNPVIIAGLVAETFCAGFTPWMRAHYTREIEDFIRVRVAHFLAEQERAKVDREQN